MAGLQYYMSSVTGSLESPSRAGLANARTPDSSLLTGRPRHTQIRKKQQKIEMILEGHKIPHETIDISSNREALKEMREKMGDDKATVPQLFNQDQWLGSFEDFLDAIEDEDGLKTFLKL
ncbi:uncharacterized protein MONBRDRAFT_37176 [Monosiga brevicollis MX1]|uniref:SH3 domain-binding glutamic acid-rich-like protein n=1 Tax=Monosiga brevicollis TaxID=81824 RepID=A9V030_MONBE|nr:uncharacterized protein MONBRDRAFT_37176 [Monosiga brevicollis MX1]EDQ89086.1 predicted protein [Monosiga brevicollis MX1]|eukprot:XP_001746191.1 hypothetical protein [Monosiga brevicollis MX1]